MPLALVPSKLRDSYPKSLTVKDWDKHKSLLAKVFAKPTGISAELEATKDTFEKIDWNAYSVDGNMPQGQNATLEKLEEVKDSILSKQKPLKDAYDAMRSLSQFLERKAVELSKKGTNVPDSTVKHIRKMADEANKFSYSIAPATISDLVMTDYANCKKSMEAARVTRLNGAKIAIGYLASTIKIGSAGNIKTVADYESYWSENVRGIGTGLVTLVVDYPELKPLIKQAAKQWAENAKPKQDKDVPQAVADTVALARQMAAVIKPK